MTTVSEPRTGRPATRAAFGPDRTILEDSWDVTWRNLLSTVRMPQALVFSAIQPIFFVCLFRYAFGGAIHVQGHAGVAPGARGAPAARGACERD